MHLNDYDSNLPLELPAAGRITASSTLNVLQCHERGKTMRWK